MMLPGDTFASDDAGISAVSWAGKLSTARLSHHHVEHDLAMVLPRGPRWCACR